MRLQCSPSLLTVLLLLCTATLPRHSSGAETDTEEGTPPWDESKDELLAEYLANKLTVNKNRILVSPWPEGKDTTNKWKWFKPEGMSYTFTPSQKIPWLGPEGGTKLGVETADSIIGILEFDDKDSHEDILELYKRLKTQKLFRQVYFDQAVSTYQGLPLGRSNSPSPRLEDFNPFDTSAVAEYREKIISAIESFRTDSFFVTPNDSMYRKLWNVRQVRGDYALREDLPTTGQGTVVAVLDTGCVMGHKDLQQNLWVNEVEANGQPGVDDDGNGFVDDIHGYNFVSDSGDVTDDNGHGSHVAGTIAAVMNNTFGVTGLAPSAKIMCIKFMDKDGSGYQSAAIMGMAYAVQQNATIQNHSWGSPGSSTALASMARLSGRLGQMLAAAAGNDGKDTDIEENTAYPAALASPELHPETSDYVISVGASDNRDKRAGFSNYGTKTVDLSAPGTNIWSLSNKASDLAVKQGTSMATPLVAATAACVMSLINLRMDATGIPDLITAADKAAMTKSIIMSAVDPVENLKGTSRTGGRLNHYSAVQLATTGEAAYIVEVPITQVYSGPAWWVWLLIALGSAAFVVCLAALVYFILVRLCPPPARRESKLQGMEMGEQPNQHYAAYPVQGETYK